MTDTNAGRANFEASRPLSPHLQVYRPLLTMMMSITHRITGVALYAGTLLLAWFLIALAAGPGPFAIAASVFVSFVWQVILFGFTWALFQHLLGGVRHFVWDMGYGMEHPEREYLALMSAVGGISLAAIAWIIRFLV